jgi:type VI secretion system protein ImpF
MAELSQRERLQPSLLDRLRDDNPERKTEPLSARSMTVGELREYVRRDLALLFNTTHFAAVADLSQYPEVEETVLNFGIPDLSGRTGSSIDVPALERELQNMIKRYEPRLLPKTITVKLAYDDDVMSHNSLTFIIDGQLWCRPLPIRLTLRTDVDVETGAVTVEETQGID